MTIEIPAKLTRKFIQEHPFLTFVHSHNAWENVWTGPASICKGLSNCYGVPVRWRLCKSSGYFQDAQISLIKDFIDKAIAKIPRGDPIILFPKIGNGDSRMHILAPLSYKYLHAELDKIKTPDVKYIYA